MNIWESAFAEYYLKGVARTLERIANALEEQNKMMKEMMSDESVTDNDNDDGGVQ